MNFDVGFHDKPMRMCVNLGDTVLVNGKSAYEVAVANGFEGTEAEWLESLHGEDGIDGKDYILTEADKQEIAEQAAELVDVTEGVGGTTDHNELTNRDALDQHPIEAITGLADALKAKLTKDDVDLVLAQAKESGAFDGYTPVKGKDYYTEEDKAELVEEVLSELPEQPSGGISVDKAEIGQTIVVKAVDENGKPTEWEAADLPEGGGGGITEAIIDVVELPTENINEDVFYRLLTGSLVFNQFVQNTYTVYCVNELPEVGEPATNADLTRGTVYYSVQDESLNAYVDNNLSAALSVPAGWYPAETLLQALGYSYSGIITDIMDDPQDGSFRLLLEYVLWQWKDKWTSLKSIGRAGTGTSAEVFNHPSNVASGHCSHAEGKDTTASGGQSHAEGWFTIAGGEDQHVQGRCNIEDSMGKYAHIVGNGYDDGHRSNAHTLDWSGLGWFAGGLKVGGTGQDDEDAKRVLTEDDVGPKLLGAITLTSENCTARNGGLSYNDELLQNVQENLAKYRTLTALPLLEAVVADFRGLFHADYYAKSTALNTAEGLQFSLTLSTGVAHISIRDDNFNAPEFVTSAILGGYPMTIKFYAV